LRSDAETRNIIRKRSVHKRHSSAHTGDLDPPFSVLRSFVTAPTSAMMSVSTVAGRGLAALLIVATLAVAAFADAGDASASASDTLVNLDGRGLHSSTFQLNLSCVCDNRTPYTL